MGEYRIDISAPNIVNVCIDHVNESGKNGRMYCCYEHAPFRFQNELQVMRRMEALMDLLDYPQNSMKTRSYHKTESQKTSQKPEKVLERDAVLKERGAQGTLVIHVKYRQNATWQGKMIHVETGEVFDFYSVLELLKIIDNEF